MAAGRRHLVYYNYIRCRIFLSFFYKRLLFNHPVEVKRSVQLVIDFGHVVRVEQKPVFFPSNFRQWRVCVEMTVQRTGLAKGQENLGGWVDNLRLICKWLTRLGEVWIGIKLYLKPYKRRKSKINLWFAPIYNLFGIYIYVVGNVYILENVITREFKGSFKLVHLCFLNSI